LHIRIIKHTSGIMDGISLSTLLPGLTYEVPVSLGTFLIAQWTAEEDTSPSVAIVIPLSEASAAVTGGLSISPPADHAHDLTRRRKRIDRRSAKKR
jgi:hypothetical protein